MQMQKACAVSTLPTLDSKIGQTFKQPGFCLKPPCASTVPTRDDQIVICGAASDGIPSTFCRVSAMAYIDGTVNTMPLTPYLNLCMLPDAGSRDTLLQTCAALRHGLTDIAGHYESATGPSQKDAVPWSLLQDPR